MPSTTTPSGVARIANSPVSSTRGAEPASPVASCVSLGGGKIVLSVAVGLALALASAASAAALARAAPCSCRSFSSASSRRACSNGMWPSREPSTLRDDVAVRALERPDDRAVLGGEHLVLVGALQVGPAARAPAEIAAARLGRRCPPTTCLASSPKVTASLPELFAPRFSFSTSASALSRAALSRLLVGVVGHLDQDLPDRAAGPAPSRTGTSSARRSPSAWPRSWWRRRRSPRRSAATSASWRAAGEAHVLEVDLAVLADEVGLHLVRRHVDAGAHQVAHARRQQLLLLFLDEGVGRRWSWTADEALEGLVVEAAVLLKRRRP